MLKIGLDGEEWEKWATQEATPVGKKYIHWVVFLVIEYII